ncbi:hypothetical protein BTO04_09135 [Polaribacter sp. SA4-10]|uniref:hypothetical protein n=1 Tax=Polaribacter sp. SA4-10 TaxID=754397 RepID=UPI000B3C789D|nr:hypothetical protein [Polaribacter sp. SA4-10]ARV06837.1 hypothetical protein BTO04_09135 [Polaribacter sp. SA4-10]
MKRGFLLIFLLTSILVFSQKKASKKFETTVSEIEISTEGLDDFVLENSESEFLEIFLYAENPNKQHIVFDEENNIATIKFNIPEFKTDEKVFRKFITKRLNRASAVVKIPKHIIVTIFGDDINIASKSCQNNLSVFIEKGNVKLNTVKENTDVKLYSGNVFATSNNTAIDVISTIGSIHVNGALVAKSYQKNEEKATKKLTINTIKANIFLTTQKTQ